MANLIKLSWNLRGGLKKKLDSKGIPLGNIEDIVEFCTPCHALSEDPQ